MENEHNDFSKPAILDLEAGKTYIWCSCKLSKIQPFCDGAHKGTDFKPRVLKVEVNQKAALCMCKKTINPPFCDGSHAHE